MKRTAYPPGATIFGRIIKTLVWLQNIVQLCSSEYFQESLYWHLQQRQRKWCALTPRTGSRRYCECIGNVWLRNFWRHLCYKLAAASVNRASLFYEVKRKTGKGGMLQPTLNTLFLAAAAEFCIQGKVVQSVPGKITLIGNQFTLKKRWPCLSRKSPWGHTIKSP